MNRLVRLVRGEGPNAYAMVARQSRGTGHIGEWLTEHALAHGGLPGRMLTRSNVLVPKDGVVAGEAELDMPVPRERGVLVFESRSCSGRVFGSEGQSMWPSRSTGPRRSVSAARRAERRPRAGAVEAPRRVFRPLRAEKGTRRRGAVPAGITSGVNMLSLKPRVPGHQRPCRQSAKGVSELLGDMDAAMRGDEDRKDDRYSSGTVILHENAADDCLDVVNGRQRLLTPALITLWLYELASFPLMTPQVQGRALRSACGCASAREAVIYRDLPCQDKRLA